MSAETPPLAPEGRRLALAGRGTTFVRELAGPPDAPVLMLLHGLGATAGLNWFRCFDALAERFRVIAMDQRGHGRGLSADPRFRLEDCADDVVAVADTLCCERVIPVGYSMGGPIAQLVALRSPSRVAGLVLCATARSFGSRNGQRRARALAPVASVWSRLLPVPVRRWLARPFYGVGIRNPRVREFVRDELRESDPAALIEAATALQRFSSHEWIGELKTPAAVVVTEHDRLVPPEHQRALAAAIPGASVHAVAAGHLACADSPELFVPALLDACTAVTR